MKSILITMLGISSILFSQGNDCSDPILLTDTVGTVISNTSLAYVTNSYAPFQDTYGPDLVYTYPNVPPNHVVSFWTTNNTFDVSMYGRYGNCSGSGANMGYTINNGQVLQWTNTTGTAQDVFFFIDSRNLNLKGTLDFHWSIVSPAEGNSCLNPILLPDSIGVLPSNTDRNSVSNRYAPFQDTYGPELVYSYPNVPPNHVVSFWTTNNTFDVSMYGRYGNCSGSGANMGYTINDGQVLQWTNTTGTAQDVFFFIDSKNTSFKGTLDFHWSIVSPAEGNSCLNPILLPDSIGVIPSNTDTNSVSNIYAPFQDTYGPELVYTYPNVPSNYVVKFWTSNNTFDVSIYGRYGTCSGSGANMGYTINDGQVLQWTNTTGTAQDVFFFIDSKNTSLKGTLDFHWEIGLPNSCNSNITISASDTIVCSGDSILFTAYGVNEGSNPMYQWKKNGINVGTNQSTYLAYGFSNSDTIICELTSNAICVGNNNTSYSNSVQIYVYPSQQIQIFQNGASLQATQGFNSYEWFFNGVTTTNYSSMIQPTQNGIYTVFGVDINGCSDSASFSWNTTSINTIDKTNLTIYPNPTSNHVSVVSSTNQTILLLDNVGRELQKVIIHSNDITPIYLEDYPAGLYLLKNDFGNVYKIIKQ